MGGCLIWLVAMFCSLVVLVAVVDVVVAVVELFDVALEVGDDAVDEDVDDESLWLWFVVMAITLVELLFDDELVSLEPVDTMSTLADELLGTGCLWLRLLLFEAAMGCRRGGGLLTVEESFLN